MDLKPFLNKRILVVVDTHQSDIPTRIFTGEIISIENGRFTFRDKFGKTILIMDDDVVRIEELGGEDG